MERHLHTQEEIATYLQAAAKEASERGEHIILLKAISTAVRARDITQIAKAAGVSRASLYKSLAADAKPRFETIMKVLDALGLQIAIVPKQSDRARHA